MLGALKREKSEDTLRFLSFRQITSEDESENGGFNGRVSKDADTCYAFWAKGAMDVSLFLEYLIDIDPGCSIIHLGRIEQKLASFKSATSSYGRICQGRRTTFWHVHVWSKLIVDPLHSSLGLAVLALDGKDGLIAFD